MAGQGDHPKSASDAKRERDVYSLHAAFRDIPHFEDLGPSPETHELPSSYVPKSATDSSLAAFCQLAAMRLNAARALISLIDDEYQYILAEATPKTSLKADSPLNKGNDLIFGNIRLPRCWGICEKVLDPSALAEEGIIVINDFQENDQYLNRSYVRSGRMRFYAGVPIVNKAGSVVGAVCIFDHNVRDGMSQDDKIYLQDLAGVVMDYLVTYTIKDRYRRAAKGLHGLMSFADAGSASASKTFSDQGQSVGLFARDQVAAKDDERDPRLEYEELTHVTRLDSLEGDGETPQHLPSIDSSTDRRRSVTDLQDSLLPATAKELFARAADIMRRSNDMSGVMFMDASYAASGLQDTRPTSDGRRCQILGFATEDQSSLKGDILVADMTPQESNLKWVLEQYPQGYVLEQLNVGAEVSQLEYGQPSPSLSDFEKTLQPNEPIPHADKDREQHTARVRSLIPGIKSALFLPFWDFERGRWFAGCFCWSTRTERVLDGRLDLPFLKAFGHSIMQEVARLDAMATSQSKTTFLSSLSHELRTPLHGILGSTHLMRNTRLDSFQVSMVNAVTVCGRTLLETVEHLLDHAERPEPNRKYSSTVSHGRNSICITSEKLGPLVPSIKTADNERCNVGFVTEEVVETMIIGEAPYNMTVDSNVNRGTSIDQTTRQAVASRRSRFVILDISDYSALGFRLSASSYGRIVMNLFGNALKFTEAGYVHLSVRSEDLTQNSGTVVLKISDSGVGMNAQFLESAFEPFRKQNQHTAGTGVGLSVVKRILEDVGGRIDVSSEPSRGTQIILKLPLERLTDSECSDTKINPLPVAMANIKGRKVCILYSGDDPNDPPEQIKHKRTMKHYVDVLTATLENVCKLDVHFTNAWDGTDDTEVMICPEVSFDSLQMIRQNAAKAGRRCPATVLIAMDILEAETLRSDARILSGESIVESVTQPCGPYKLSVVVNACLQHYDSLETPNTPTTQSTFKHAYHGGWASPLPSSDSTNEFSARLGMYHPPLVVRTKSDPSFEETISPVVQAQSPPKDIRNEEDSDKPLRTEHALVVDDNAINRRVLSAWMKKHSIPYNEVKDGQQALDLYKEANGQFDAVLMDISMPVMDGMTATRLIREFEKERGLTPTHIIALTGLTSASAKLEAWTSGVDDYLTKPVDFKRLEKLLEVGRGGEGTGFMKEHGSIP